MGKRIRRLIHRYVGCPVQGIQYHVDPQAVQAGGITQVRGYGILCAGCDRFWHGDSPAFQAWWAARAQSPGFVCRRI